ncbi:2OG-Fe(II) oxygenase [Variovorax sp. PCZ-1]|uniref:2OG-Fe(II) oxygenase n=1 Tax=Variovorax sp. PCZ-1 TaxID=2835533 RepID=UPI001BCFC652|nr:2OG-Fe(II) oxygenase [Variovorax sp. PCZ-1]MBS7807920.1 2OG-Fe(II) oxygenase [Variovorax sp. PCZ-1]
MAWLKWLRGRQGTGYDKMLLATARWPLPFDCYLLRYPQGSAIPPHTDPVTDKRHYRLNIVVKRAVEGGDFLCATPIFATARIKLFRPDACEHAVSEVKKGSRYVFSLGWVLPSQVTR